MPDQRTAIPLAALFIMIFLGLMLILTSEALAVDGQILGRHNAEELNLAECKINVMADFEDRLCPRGASVRS